MPLQLFGNFRNKTKLYTEADASERSLLFISILFVRRNYPSNLRLRHNNPKPCAALLSVSFNHFHPGGARKRNFCCCIYAVTVVMRKMISLNIMLPPALSTYSTTRGCFSTHDMFLSHMKAFAIKEVVDAALTDGCMIDDLRCCTRLNHYCFPNL